MIKIGIGKKIVKGKKRLYIRITNSRTRKGKKSKLDLIESEDQKFKKVQSPDAQET